ncbi:hypothetical protein GH714_018272 [Hevea brasiliensis]|uniref:NB-ARC domain-containing protein n=1 Tax=Hevea brasiliensis TaxID=3981 RepID=A0A6A6LTI3_HEVBR|nr:hypothetical protein GH714_018272 [Hevea brasiliensis]
MNLKIIEVVACGSVIWLFRGDILNSLQNLEEIVVGDCAKMRAGKHLRWSHHSHFLRSVDILGCNALKRLPMALFDDSNLPQQLPPPSLKEIKGTLSWWESLEWDQPEAKTILHPYFIEEDAEMLKHRLEQ